MAKNTGTGHRKGVVSNRTQVYNAKTDKYIKRDTTTGKFLSSKKTPYKNIRNEAVIKKMKEDRENKKQENKKQVTKK